jgi:hypothetical protein
MEMLQVYSETKLLGLSRVGVSAPTLKTYKTVAGSPAATELFAFAANAVNKLTASDDMSHQWKEGTPIEVHIHWNVLPSDNIAAGDVKFFAAISVADWNDGSTYEDFLLTAIDHVPENCGGTSRFVTLGYFLPAGKKISFQGLYCWGREGNAAADTWTGECYVSSFAIHWEKDTNGSTSKYVKV